MATTTPLQYVVYADWLEHARYHSQFFVRILDEQDPLQWYLYINIGKTDGVVRVKAEKDKMVHNSTTSKDYRTVDRKEMFNIILRVLALYER